MSNQTPYHGPHVVFSRQEIERLHHIMYHPKVDSILSEVDDSIRGKLDAALKSHPDFLKPAK